MLKRWIIKAAFWYLDRYFNKWLSTRGEKEEILNLLVGFQEYLRALKSKNAKHLADLLEEWKD